MGKHLAPIIAAIAPPAAAFAFLQTWATAHPLRAIAVLLAWQVLVWGATFVSNFVGGTADELRTRWKDPFAKWIDERIRRRLSRFDRRYRDSVLGSLRFIDLKGLATQGFYTPQLDEVFVDVSLIHSDPSAVPADVLGRRHVDPVRRFIGDLIDKHDPVVLAVIGAPGCGKTTLLRHTALLMCRKRRRRRRIPVLLYLRDHVQAITEGTALPDLVHKDAPVGWFEQKLRAGSCVILLDGLDEVADQQNRREVSDWVESQVARYPSNDFVITSRPHGYQTAPISGATVVQVRGFTDEQVTRFVGSWYLAFEQRSTGEKSADVTRRATEETNDLLERLHHNFALYELTVNPLLLTMIANVHKFRGALPGSRADLYSEICQVLLWRRHVAKKLSSELTGDQKMVLLSSLAFTMMSRKLRDISREHIRIEFRSFLRRTARRMSEDDLLTNITSSGLLVERERDLFAFAHLTFQEYFAAHHTREKHQIDVLVDNVNDAWWRETTLLHVARGNTDLIVQACLTSGTVTALSLAFDCSEEGSDLAPELRTKLDQLLENLFKSQENTPMRNLMIRVVLSRHLRKAVRSDRGARLCAEPVTTRLYNLFLESHPHRTPDGPPCEPDEPIRGVRLDDAHAFVEWVNDGATAEQTFRLPSAMELMSSPIASKLSSLPPWTMDSFMTAWLPCNLVSVSVQAVYTDLEADVALLPEIFETAQRIRTAHASTGTLFLPNPTRLQILQLRHLPVTTDYENAIGRALVEATDQVSNPFTFALRLRGIFTAAVDNEDALTVLLPLNLEKMVTSVENAPLTRWGKANLPSFVDSARSTFSRSRPLTNELAAELRIAAMWMTASQPCVCLSKSA